MFLLTLDVFFFLFLDVVNWLCESRVEAQWEEISVSSIYQQSSYSWELALCGVMSYPGRKAKASPLIRAAVPVVLLSFI